MYYTNLRNYVRYLMNWPYKHFYRFQSVTLAEVFPPNALCVVYFKIRITSVQIAES